MRKPVNITYGLHDRPPAAVVASTALQQVSIILVVMFPAILLAREIAAPPGQAAALFSMTLAACGLATILQAQTRWGIGCGYLGC